MADARIRAVITAEDRASSVVAGFGSSVRGMASAVAIGTLAARGLTLAMEKLGEAGKFAIASAADMEQNRIAFETMLGSAAKAKVLLKDLSDFAVKTPFKLPEVVTGARQLLAYGISADKLLPTFKALGEIAAGVGKEKLPFLTLAFGQVATKGKLAGQEIRQFTEAGVPLVAQLAKVLGRTKEEIIEMSEAGEIGFADVEKAIFSMSGEGGKFFNLMERQAKTLGGVTSNIIDQFGRVARSIVGISETGDIKEGSIFAKLSTAGQAFLAWLNTNSVQITTFFQGLADILLLLIRIQGEWVTFWIQRFEELRNYLATNNFFKETWNGWRMQINELRSAIDVHLIPAVRRLLQAISPELVGAFKIVGFAGITAISLILQRMREVVAAASFIIEKIGQVKNAFDRLAPSVKNALGNFIPGAGLLNALGKLGGRAAGGPVTGGTPYIVGERGPELFVPNQSGQIIPNGRTPANTTNNYNLSVNVGTFVGTEMEKRKLAEELFRAYNDLQSARGVAA